MKKCKRLTAAVLAVAMAVTGLPSVTAEGYISVADVMKAAGAVSEVNAGEESPAGDFEYVVNEDGNITITGYKGDGGDVVIPSVIDGKKVTVIGERAFYYCTSLTSMEISDSVTVIGNYAFLGCTSLTSAVIPNSVTAIGWSAFSRCTSLTSVKIPDGVTWIADGAFSGCSSLISVEIPDSVATIGYGAFENCTSLTSVEIPDSVTMIGSNVFFGCTSLTSINVDEKNSSFSSVGGVLFNKDKTTLIQYPAGKEDKNYSIPKSVTVIGNGAFSGCKSLTSIEIPNGVTAIGYSAFFGCTSLTSVEIPDSVTEIGDSAFSYCSLTSVKIPDGVTEIGTWVFYGCKSLTSVEIPDSVTVIGDSAFYACNSLASVEIPDSVTVIGSRAFSYCTSLTSVEISDSVTEIGDGAFSGCNSLTTINVDEKNTAYSSVDGVLFNKDKTTLMQYPAGKEDKNYSIPGSVTEIGSLAFSACTSLTSVEIPDSVANIGHHAFFDCASLTSVEIPGSVTVIEYNAFYGCTSLTSVEIPDSVTVIGSSAFSVCTSLTSINVDEKNTAYSSVDGVLFNKDKTTLIQYPAGKTDKSYSIPGSVTAINGGAFLGCTSLTSVEIPDSVTEIGNYAFNGGTSMTIYGYTGSYAEIYADRNAIPFVSIDDSTKIQIEGGVVVTVPENSEATLEGKTLEVESASSDENSAAFNITLRDEEGNEVQPGGEVSVKIPVPAHLDGEKCNVYRKEADGTYTELKSTYENGCLIFITDHFSEYVISAVKPVSIQLGNLNGDDKVSTVDAKWVLQAISGSRTLTEEQKAAADVNKDGKITTVDAKWILQSVSGSRDLE